MIARRWLVAGVALLVALAPGRVAKAEDDALCVETHREAQRSRREHRLLDARRHLVACARPSCPALVREDCTQWLAEVLPLVPSVVFDVRAGERPVYEGRVWLDGREVASLDGRAIELDPGEHRVRVESAEGGSGDVRFTVREGAPSQPVRLALQPRSAAREERAAPGARRGIPALSWVLGGVSLVGFGSFAAFGAVGVSQKADLDAAGCRPSCASADVSAARRSFVAADVSLGVGVVSLAAAVLIYALRGEAPAAKPSAARAPSWFE